MRGPLRQYAQRSVCISHHAWRLRHMGAARRPARHWGGNPLATLPALGQKRKGRARYAMLEPHGNTKKVGSVSHPVCHSSSEPRFFADALYVDSPQLARASLHLQAPGAVLGPRGRGAAPWLQARERGLRARAARPACAPGTLARTFRRARLASADSFGGHLLQS